MLQFSSYIYIIFLYLLLLLLLLLLLCLFQTSTLFASADRSETADYNNLGNFLSCFK